MTDLDNPMAILSAVGHHLEATGEVPEGWHYQELPTYPIPVEFSESVPPGMVCISAPGSDVLYFAYPGSLVYADFGTIDLGIIREEADA